MRVSIFLGWAGNNISPALKHCLMSVATFAMDLFFWPESFRSFRSELSELFFPLVMDGCMEDMHDLVIKIPQRIMLGGSSGTATGSTPFQDTDEFQEKVELKTMCPVHEPIPEDLKRNTEHAFFYRPLYTSSAFSTRS